MTKPAKKVGHYAAGPDGKPAGGEGEAPRAQLWRTSPTQDHAFSEPGGFLEFGEGALSEFEAGGLW